jgi:hypothetical protein
VELAQQLLREVILLIEAEERGFADNLAVNPQHQSGLARHGPCLCNRKLELDLANAFYRQRLAAERAVDVVDAQGLAINLDVKVCRAAIVLQQDLAQFLRIWECQVGMQSCQGRSRCRGLQGRRVYG